MRVIRGDLDDPQVVSLLELHAARARAQTARGSAHALDVEQFRSPELSLWAVWEDPVLLGVGALKRLAPDHGEVKSMFTADSARRRGVASAMMQTLIAEAQRSGLTRLSLETGSWDYFQPARAFYRRHGFVECAPFAGYRPDPNSIFMTLALPP